jgi:antitoxin component YwqK of YwqJK toxin-antitoxin module
MIQRLSLLSILFILGCKTEWRNNIETYANGKVKKEYVYADKNNLKRYTIYEYFETGQPKFIATIENEKFVDSTLSYYDNGFLSETVKLIKPCEMSDSNCDRKIVKYYRNGNINKEYELMNGKINGEEYTYALDSTGRKGSIYMYKEGKLNGEYKVYRRRTGKYLCTGSYLNDTIVGNEYYYDSNGDSLQITFYMKGKEDFPMKKWLRTGQIFYADYLDNTHKKVLYRWTDRNGKEIKREIVSKINKYILSSEELAGKI